MATGPNLDQPSSLPLPELPPDHAPGEVPAIVELTPENVTVTGAQEPQTEVDWPPADQRGPDNPPDTPGWSEARMPSVSQGYQPTGVGPGGQDYPGEVSPQPPENVATAGAPSVSVIGDHTATAAELMQEAEES